MPYRFLSFQWDILLLETGLVALLSAPLLPTRWELGAGSWGTFTRDAPSQPEAKSPTRGAVARASTGLWLAQWLLFRLMFASGAVKLLWGDPDWWGLTALAAHFQSTCLPTPLSAWAHRLAPALLKASVALTYVVEMPAALLCILPAVNWGGLVTARRLGAALQAAFQLAIMATGNCPSGLASSFVSV